MILDDRDLMILRMLLQDSTMSYKKMAKALGISDVAIAKRVKRLRDFGVIERFTIKLNPKGMGYNEVALLCIEVRPRNADEVLKQVSARSDVNFVAQGLGDYNIVLEVWERDREALEEAINWIKNLKGVLSIKYINIMRVVKEGMSVRS